MIIKSIAPSRVSLFGGGTDLEEYYKDHGGLVINFAIDLYATTTLFEGDDIFQPQNSFPYTADDKFYYNLLAEYDINSIHHSKIHANFDGIIKSGIGSSAAAAVSLISAISKRKNLDLTLDQIADKAYQYEIEQGIQGGRQDQIASAYGGVNVIEFKDEIKVVPLAKGFIEPLLPSLQLFYYGEQRKSGNIQKGFNTLTKKQIEALDHIKELAVLSIDFIARGDFTTVGKMLDEAWEFKKQSNKVSNQGFDEVYDKALKLGALGGKLCGAGQGGYALFIVPPESKEKFLKDFPLEKVDFNISWNGVSSRII